MALDYNYYKLGLPNKTEVFLRSDWELNTLLQQFSEETEKTYLGLKRVDTDKDVSPTYYRVSSIATIQQVSRTLVGNNNKLWEMVQ